MSFDLDLPASPGFCQVCRNSVSQLLRSCKDQTTTPGTLRPTVYEVHCFSVHPALCVFFFSYETFMAPGVRVSMILTLNLSRKNGKVEYFINLIKL